jgi:hypothetical protein
MENVALLNGQLGYMMAICSTLGPLVHFSRFGMLHQEKSGIPGREHDQSIATKTIWRAFLSN